MEDKKDLACLVCGHVGLDDGSDGFFYCQRCGSQAEDIRDTAEDHEDIFEGRQASQVRRVKAVDTVRKQVIESQSQSQFWQSLNSLEDSKVDADDGVGPVEPSDFGSVLKTLNYEDYYSEIRLKYVMGIQIMIQLQCKALVENFHASPLIIGMAGTLWLRFVASSKVFDDGWADEVINESESQRQGQEDPVKLSAFHDEPRNMHGQRAILIWYRSINKTIPLSYSLVISFLVCHMTREAILPTDIVKWALEGKLPYFSAFLEIEKQVGPHSTACPIRPSRMFRPPNILSAQKLESLVASVADIIGLELPPVNFYGIASRYLLQLSLPADKILRYGCRLYEWSTPPELWLSANESRLPTRGSVMSIIIIAIRLLYNINGLGKWEGSLFLRSKDQNVDGDSDQLGADELLLTNLESKFNELDDTYEYSKDLPTYLKYCKDVVFARLEPSLEDREEEMIIEELWDFYQNKKDFDSFNDGGSSESKKVKDKGRENNRKPSFDGKTYVEPYRDRKIRQLRSNMEENRFCYIAPRVNVKKNEDDYLCYTRKKDEGAYTYAAHADYYILLRSCARLAQLDIRNMHVAVLSLERRLSWLEKRIDHCLKVKPPNDTCDFCSNDSTGLSNMNL